MKKYLLLVLLLPVTVSLWANGNIPYRTVEETDSCIYVTYVFRDPHIQDDLLFPGCQYWKIDGFGLNKVPGEPSVPCRYDTFIVPEGMSATVSMMNVEYSDVPFTMAPSRPLSIKNDMVRHVPEIKPYTGFFPSEIIAMRKMKYYRGVPYVRVALYPLQYDYEHHIVRRYFSIKYKVNFHSTEGREISKTSNSLERLNNNIVLNNIALNSPLNTSRRKKISASLNYVTEDNKNYVILTTEKFRVAAERLAEWKRIQGKRVLLKIKNNWLNKYEVNDTLRDSYYLTNDGIEWNGIAGFDYVLFIGRAEDVPTSLEFFQDVEDGTEPIDEWNYYSDNWYFNYNDPGYINPYHGRLLANTLAEATTIVDKIINYERNPPLNDSFYRTGLNLAYFQDGEDLGVPRNGYEDRRFVLTSEEIKTGVEHNGLNVTRLYYTPSIVTPTHWNNDYYSFGSNIPSELLKPSFKWNCTYDTIITHFNDGALYALYNGHGNEYSWASLGFNTFHVDTLRNGNKLPVVFSMTCQTGDFSYPNCFAEKMLKRPNGGGVAVFAQTQISYSGWDDAFAEGMFDAIWPNSGIIPTFPAISGTSQGPVTTTPTPTYELGQIKDQGLFRMEETWVTPPWYDYMTDYLKDISHCFGDPSMQIWTDIPHNFEEPSIVRTKDSIFVQVNDGEARITFYAPSTGHVDSYVGTSVRYAALEDSITICINRHNYIPYIRECNIVFLQNETLTGTQNIEAEFILAGSHVTDQKPTGSLIMDGGNIRLNGRNKVELHSGTRIEHGTKVIINKN